MLWCVVGINVYVVLWCGGLATARHFLSVILVWCGPCGTVGGQSEAVRRPFVIVDASHPPNHIYISLSLPCLLACLGGVRVVVVGDVREGDLGGVEVLEGHVHLLERRAEELRLVGWGDFL